MPKKQSGNKRNKQRITKHKQMKKEKSFINKYCIYKIKKKE